MGGDIYRSVKETFTLLFVFSVIGKVLSNPSCPKLKPGMTNVHLVCHTHDDVGWLKTVDQYYYGSRKTITWVGVQYILDSVVASLLRDPERKFIYVESAFFFRWWDEQSEHTKAIVKRLVERGQLEFINGGWCMNDEAAAHYNAIIDQMTLGLTKLNDTFGPAGVPRIAWQIDPFGHSKEQASLFAQIGFDGLFFGRLDHSDKSKRWQKRELEMVWKGSNSLGGEASLFTGVLPNGYSPPQGFCFDLLCPNDPIMDDPRLEDYNKEKMVDRFIAAVDHQRTGYATSNLIMTMGEDFDYVYAEAYFKNLDKLIRYVNERQQNGSKVNLVYSTPSCYLDSLHDANLKWPTKTDDFFPYSSDPHAYWTGYFTSRPTLKGFIRQCNNLLQAVKQISALAGLGRGPSLDTLSQAMAVAQHHDAVTGTAKQHVTDDYSKRLSKGVAASVEALQEGFRILTKPPNAIPGVQKFDFCPLLNVSACPPSESSKSFVVNVYNPIARSRNHYVRIPVAQALSFQVTDQSGTRLKTQVVPLPEQVKRIPGRKSSANFELVFYAKDLPPLGTKQFLVKGQMKGQKVLSQRISPLQDTVMTKGQLSIALDSKSNMLKFVEIKNSKGSKKINASQNWLWYKGKRGDNSEFDSRASGAYIFRPDGKINHFTSNVKLNAFYDGPLVGEFHQEWSPWVSQILRLYKDKNFVEIDWLVGPIPVHDGIGKEIVNLVQWQDMATNGTFFTDANGREMQRRVKDNRETWSLNSSEPVSQNYYPVTSRLLLSSTNEMGKAAILNDRAQGGTSLSDGEMELMVHRRLLDDDAFGVGEPLNETAFGEGLVARGRHILLHSEFASTECDFGCLHRTLGEELLLQPIIGFSSESSFSKITKNSAQRSNPISPLPPNMRLLTLEPWTSGRWLLRLENFYEPNESSNSGNACVNIQILFPEWDITNIQEVTLGANQWKSDNHRLHWNTISDDVTGSSADSEGVEDTNCPYSFSPMQIRSFLVDVSKK